MPPPVAAVQQVLLRSGFGEHRPPVTPGFHLTAGPGRRRVLVGVRPAAATADLIGGRLLGYYAMALLMAGFHVDLHGSHLSVQRRPPTGRRHRW
jgi:hypothetical protein